MKPILDPRPARHGVAPSVILLALLLSTTLALSACGGGDSAESAADRVIAQAAEAPAAPADLTEPPPASFVSER